MPRRPWRRSSTNDSFLLFLFLLLMPRFELEFPRMATHRIDPVPLLTHLVYSYSYHFAVALFFFFVEFPLCVLPITIPQEKNHILLASRYDVHLHRFGRASARSGRAFCRTDFLVVGHRAVFISSIAAAAATISKMSAHLESSRVDIMF